MGNAHDTLPARFFANARRFASRIIHHYPSGDRWFPVGWSTAANLVRDLASGLISLGHQAKDPVAIIANTRREWTYCDLAVLAAGGISVAIPPTADAPTCRDMLAHSDARICIVEDAVQLAKVVPHMTELTALHHIVAIDRITDRRITGRAVAPLRESGTSHSLPERPVDDSISLPTSADRRILSYDELLRIGRREARDVQGRLSALSSLDAAVFLYTSGSTGRPRAAMLTHGNVTAALRSFEVFGFRPTDTTLSLLPMSYGLARAMEYYALWIGMPSAYAKITDNTGALHGLGQGDPLAAAASRVQPTVMVGVPALFERLRLSIYDEVCGSAAGLKLFDWASAVAQSLTQQQRRAHRSTPALQAQRRILRALLFERLTARLGGRVRTAVVMGGHPAHGVCEFFEAAGIRVLVGWGMSETFFAGTAGPARASKEQAASPLPDIELALADDGEILMRGPQVFSGYLKAESETASAFTPDGFFRTGDLAAQTLDGKYHILGRKRDVIVTEAGTRLAPQRIEAWMRGDPRISHTVVVGHGRPYLGALVAVSDSLRHSCDEDTLIGIVEGIVAALNVELPRSDQIGRIRLLPHDLGVATGELTPAYQVKRDVVAAKFAYLIDEIYE
ncbi:MAG: AMP-binding protein [Proteobacteria bacterium]|nr:AMP-binding protein [Pseudomonadota bacterium]